MQQLQSLFIMAMFFVVFFVLPIAAVIAFVNMRAKARREMLAGPWSALAAHFGGRMEGDRVLVHRDVYRMTLGMQLVSVMQAAGSPFYPDGGTYTEARLELDPRAGLQVAAVSKPERVITQELVHKLGQSPLSGLPPDARVVLGAQGAAVVLPGAVSDPNALGAAFGGLQAILEHVRTRGPLTVTPAR